ncbi:MAG: CoA transferase, partial [Gammaproteobacteria bacterium]|nr:CoA transferase [Gammaproteobacteria bacterium]
PPNMSAPFLSVNSGKRSMTLNLKSPGAKDVVRRLVEQSDVVVQNFKVGVMDRLGLSYDAVREFNPGIVYCSISGYGQEGPRSRAPAYDPAVQSASGMMQLIGTGDSGPLRTGFPLVDMSTGLTAAIAIMGALYRRKETGAGQHLDVAMLDSAMSLLAFSFMLHQQTGDEPELLGNQSQLRIPTADVYPASEGFVQITALTDKQVIALCEAIGLSHLMDDPKYKNNDARAENRDEMRQHLLDAFAKKPASEWESILGEAQVPSSAVLRIPEVIAQPQLAHRNFLQSVLPQGFSTPLQVFNAAYGASEDGPAVTSPPPAVGEHTDEVLGEFGFSSSEVSALRADDVI